MVVAATGILARIPKLPNEGVIPLGGVAIRAFSAPAEESPARTTAIRGNSRLVAGSTAIVSGSRTKIQTTVATIATTSRLTTTV